MRNDPVNRLHDDDDAPKPRLISIALLPAAATLGNLLCGFLAVYCCLLAIRSEYFDTTALHAAHRFAGLLPTFIALGAYLILLAMIFDALDGRLARLTRRTSEFGAQLDSIADIVSFGAAPALLFLTLLLVRAVPPDGSVPIVGKYEWRFGLMCALVFLSCAAIRLARYNAENIRSEAVQKEFSGLPVPGAAAGMIALLILHEDLVYEASSWATVVRWSFGPTALALGLLMVSRLDYVHVFNLYVRREQPPIHLVGLVVALVLAWWWTQIMLVVGAFAYIISGFVLNLRRRTTVPIRMTESQSKTPADMN